MNRITHSLLLVCAIRINIRKVNDKYLTRFIWIVMGGCMCDESNGCV